MTWEPAQARPHAPQFCGSSPSGVSQPSAAFPLQSPKPASHVKPQALPAQAGCAWAGAVQTDPHAPQFCGADAIWTSQPFDATPSQSA
jgi:hypothetical protein